MKKQSPNGEDRMVRSEVAELATSTAKALEDRRRRHSCHDLLNAGHATERRKCNGQNHVPTRSRTVSPDLSPERELPVAETRS